MRQGREGTRFSAHATALCTVACDHVLLDDAQGCRAGRTSMQGLRTSYDGMPPNTFRVPCIARLVVGRRSPNDLHGAIHQQSHAREQRHCVGLLDASARGRLREQIPEDVAHQRE